MSSIMLQSKPNRKRDWNGYLSAVMAHTNKCFKNPKWYEVPDVNPDDYGFNCFVSGKYETAREQHYKSKYDNNRIKHYKSKCLEGDEPLDF